MQLLKDYKTDFKKGKFDEKLKQLYHNIENSKIRLISAIDSFSFLFGEDNLIDIFSAPGRTEITGNHTDHQHGLCLAASVDLDVIAVVSKSDSNMIRVKSEGFDMDCINLDDLEIKEAEFDTSLALIKGIVAKFINLGYSVSGFDAYTTSNVLKGSGLSSSAAFEILIANIINHLFCHEKETPISLAKIGKYAENVYFGKPCGLLDQMTSSVGGFVYMDFESNENPIVEKINFNFSEHGYSLCIVDTGGNHSDLTDDYSIIFQDLKKVCAYFDKNVLREVDENQFYKNIPNLRKQVSDRAILRAIHVFDENKRVLEQTEALKKGDFEQFKKIILSSGNSSYKYLQNIYSISVPDEQGLALALALCEKVLSDEGAYRMHGGGFAGTIQAFVPQNKVAAFKQNMEYIFGENKCYILNIRPFGGYKF